MIDPVSAFFTAVGGIIQEVVPEAVAHVFIAAGRREWKTRRPPTLSDAQMRRLTGEAATRLRTDLGPEFGATTDSDWTVATEAVKRVIAAAKPHGVTDAVAHGMDPSRLEHTLRAQPQHRLETSEFGEAEEAVYDRVLAASCVLLIRAVRRLPYFDKLVAAATLKKVQDLQATVDDLAEAIERLARERDRKAQDADQKFERRYLKHVVKSLGRLELFGVSRLGVPSRHPIDETYVHLAVARSRRNPDGDGADDEDELTGAGLDVLSAFEHTTQVVVRGGAGGGKSTLLEWLAVRAAREERSGGRWDQVVPFLVRLRRVARTGFPALEDLPKLVMGDLAGERPDGWVRRQFDAGRALLLVDGLDELEPTLRPQAKEWLGQLVTSYQDARYVVTTRPLADDDDLLADDGFDTFDLLPLSPQGIGTFIGKWHDAARAASQSDEDADADRRMKLKQYEAVLMERLSARPELRSFSNSPLLCGLLCALHAHHRDRGTELPTNRRGLYDDALELLLGNWDESREVQVDELPDLSEEEQTVLLQRFAYHFVKNHRQVVSRVDATEQVGNAMRGFKSTRDDPARIMQRLLERTGLLRAPDPDIVQFVHRTFQDYLAAKEVVDSGDLELLVEHAHEEHWHEVAVSYMAHADLRKRDQMLERLLAGNAEARADDHVRDRLHLLAAACLAQVDVLLTDETRQQVEQAAERLIPPATLNDAELLAKAGPFVLDLLPGPAGLTQEQASAVVRTIATVGGDRAWDKLAAFVDVGGASVIDELLRAWRHAQGPKEYARTVLSRVDFGDRLVELQASHRVEHLRWTNLANLKLSGDFGRMGQVAAIPRLRHLVLNQNDMVRDLGPLAACPTLRTLELQGGGQLLRSLSPLADSTVEELALLLVKTGLGSLRARNLRRLHVRDPRLRDGLGVLPADLPLRELTILNPPRSPTCSAWNAGRSWSLSRSGASPEPRRSRPSCGCPT